MGWHQLSTVPPRHAAVLCRRSPGLGRGACRGPEIAWPCIAMRTSLQPSQARMAVVVLGRLSTSSHSAKSPASMVGATPAAAARACDRAGPSLMVSQRRAGSAACSAAATLASRRAVLHASWEPALPSCCAFSAHLAQLLQRLQQPVLVGLRAQQRGRVDIGAQGSVQQQRSAAPVLSQHVGRGAQQQRGARTQELGALHGRGAEGGGQHPTLDGAARDQRAR
jgi:hypothetical protein